MSFYPPAFGLEPSVWSSTKSVQSKPRFSGSPANAPQEIAQFTSAMTQGVMPGSRVSSITIADQLLTGLGQMERAMFAYRHPNSPGRTAPFDESALQQHQRAFVEGLIQFVENAQAGQNANFSYRLHAGGQMHMAYNPESKTLQLSASNNEAGFTEFWKERYKRLVDPADSVFYSIRIPLTGRGN